MKVYNATLTMPQDGDHPVSGWVASTLELARQRCLDDYLNSCHIEKGDTDYNKFKSHLAPSLWEEDFKYETNRKWWCDVDGQLTYVIFETELIEAAPAEVVRFGGPDGPAVNEMLARKS